MRPPSTERDGERKLLWAAFQVSYYLDELAVLLIRLPYGPTRQHDALLRPPDRPDRLTEITEALEV